MKSNLSKFFIGLTKFTLAILVIGAILFFTVFEQYFLFVFPFVLFFYYVSTLIFHKYMLRITRNDVSRFSFKFMMLSFLKMFVYIVFGVLYIIFYDDNAIIFLVVYLLLYVTYSVYEVKSVMKLINEKK